MEKRDDGSGIRCNEHPDAPHSFMRDASHSAGRYVCECEFWEPQGVKIHAGPYGEAWIAQDGPLLATKREWQGLTDDEIAQLMFKCDVIVTGPTQFDFARAIETKLRSKNGG